MRSLRQCNSNNVWPALRQARGQLLGLPFVLAASVPGIVAGWQTCIAALTIACLACFLVYLPLTALALNGGSPLTEHEPVPAFTLRAYLVLLVLWTVTAWLGAAAVTACT
jgi:hypothetical protein